MSVDPGQLWDAIAGRDAPRVRDLLRGAGEADRAACAKALRPLLRDDPALLKQLFPNPVYFAQLQAGPAGLRGQQAEDAKLWRQYREIYRLRDSAAFLAAALGLAGGVAEACRVAQEYDHYGQPASPDLDAIAGVLADRRPPWLAEFVDRHLNLQSRFLIGVDAWQLARRLVRLGVIGRPGVPGYTTLMPAALYHAVPVQQRLAATPAQELLADPGLLQVEVWRLFTVPDAAWAVERHESHFSFPDQAPVPGGPGRRAW